MFLTLALDGGEWVIGCFKCHVFLENCSQKMKNKNCKPLLSMYLSPFCHYFWSSCKLQVLEVAVYQIQITPITTLSIVALNIGGIN